MEKSTSYETSHYAVFSNLLSLQSTSVQIFSSTLSSSRYNTQRKDANVEAGGNPSNRLTENIELYEEEGNGRGELSSHWLAVGQNETAGPSLLFLSPIGSLGGRVGERFHFVPRRANGNRVPLLLPI
jgi:hypothetical protein